MLTPKDFNLVLGWSVSPSRPPCMPDSEGLIVFRRMRPDLQYAAYDYVGVKKEGDLYHVSASLAGYIAFNGGETHEFNYPYTTITSTEKDAVRLALAGPASRVQAKMDHFFEPFVCYTISTSRDAYFKLGKVGVPDCVSFVLTPQDAEPRAGTSLLLYPDHAIHYLFVRREEEPWRYYISNLVSLNYPINVDRLSRAVNR